MDIVGKRRWFAAISATVILVGALFLAIPPHLNLGIDFLSGTSLTVDFETDPGAENVRAALREIGHPEAVVQSAGAGSYFIRTRDLGEIGIEDVQAGLQDRLAVSFTIPEITTVGRIVAGDTIRNAIVAVTVASIFVMLYIMYAFRSVPHAHRYALGAVIALLHDVAIVLGMFAILGRFIGAEVNAIFIVGILTVIGYSVNDTIVVFDRIRENVALSPNRLFRSSVNLSINETIGRSLGTSITTSLVILAMLLFGGPTLRDFLLVLLIGVLVGTYSSIFVAAQFLVFWEEGELGRLLRRGRGRRRATAPEPA